MLVRQLSGQLNIEDSADGYVAHVTFPAAGTRDMGADVLIVEDQVLIAIHLQDLVEEAGHRVMAIAHETAEALAAAARQRPAFAIMDLRLANGCERPGCRAAVL